MKILKISKKKNNMYNIILSDNTSLSFYDDVIIKYNLLRPREITQKEIEEICKYNETIRAYSISLKYITTKLRTKKEIAKKLKDFDSNIVDQTIKRLEKEGYLSDDLYLKSYVADQVNLSLKGPKKICRELVSSGFKEEKINPFILNIEENIWKEKIIKIINKKQKGNHNLSKKSLIQKITKDLYNLGYEKNLIDECISNTEFLESEEVLKKEFNKELRKLSRKYQDNELKNKLKYNLYKKGFSLDLVDALIVKELD